jgi:hypothetical protein
MVDYSADISIPMCKNCGRAPLRVGTLLGIAPSGYRVQVRTMWKDHSNPATPAIRLIIKTTTPAFKNA